MAGAAALTGLLVACIVNFGCAPRSTSHLTLTSIAVSHPIAGVPKHVLTWAYDDTGIGGMSATPSQVRAFTNFDEERASHGKAERDCYPGAGSMACRAVWYLRGTLLYAQDPPDRYLMTQLDSEHLGNDIGFFHNTTKTPIDRVTNKGPALRFCVPTSHGPCLYANLSNQKVISFIVGCLLQGGSGSACAGHRFSGPAAGTEIFEDNTPAVCENIDGIGVYFHGGSSTFTPVELGREPNCDNNLHATVRSYLAALKYANGSQARAWLNGYAPLCGRLTCAYPAGAATYWTQGSAPALGVIDEGTVCGSATDPTTGYIGAVVLDDMAQLFNEATSGRFVLLNYSQATAGSAQQLHMRRYCDGVFWLGFNVSRSVLWSNYSNGNRTIATANVLAVYPEQQIVPTTAIETMGDVTTSTFSHNGTGCNANRRFDTSMSGGAHDLVVACGVDTSGNAVGVYVREFRKCYSWGSLIGHGQCAVVVDMMNAPAAIGGSSRNPWKYPNGRVALSQSYNEMLIISGKDMVTDGCSTVSGCPMGRGTDLNFGGTFNLGITQVNAGDAAYLFHS